MSDPSHPPCFDSLEILFKNYNLRSYSLCIFVHYALYSLRVGRQADRDRYIIADKCNQIRWARCARIVLEK